MENNQNILVRLLDNARDFLEHASPSLFALMSTLLPYLSPLPIAVMTSKNATSYLGFSPNISGIFVFVLEALGLWVTSTLVDSVIEYIRSRNWKTGIMIGVFSVVTIIYISILINLNVTLESSDPTKTITTAYSRVITLISFIPLLTGFMNGWHKAKLDGKKEMETTRIRNEAKESQLRKEEDEKNQRILDKKQAEKLMKQAMKMGYTPEQTVVFMQNAMGINLQKVQDILQDDVQNNSDSTQVNNNLHNKSTNNNPKNNVAQSSNGNNVPNFDFSQLSPDWRITKTMLPASVKMWMAKEATAQQVASLCNIKLRSAYGWIENAKKELGI